MRLRYWLWLLVPAVCLSSCFVAVAAAGAGVTAAQVGDNGYAYRFDQGLQECAAAAVLALRENGYAVADLPTPTEDSVTIDYGDIEVEMHFAEAAPSSNTPRGTRVTVRVGTFAREDNRNVASLVMSAMFRRLEPDWIKQRQGMPTLPSVIDVIKNAVGGNDGK
jgi:hypothetical protein